MLKQVKKKLGAFLRVDQIFSAAILKVGVVSFFSKIRHGYTLLHFAIWLDGHSQLVAPLLEAGAKVNATTSQGESPLHFAVQSGNVEAVDQLLSAGANPNIKDKDGRTPLLFAAQNNQQYIVAKLLNAGANPNVKGKDGETPLQFAALSGNVEAVAKLLEAGADVNAKKSYYPGNTPLHLAAYKGELDVVVKLLEAGADVNAKDSCGCTPLHDAVRFNNLEAVTQLLDAGANVDIKNWDGQTPLDVMTGFDEFIEEPAMITCNHIPTIILLIEAGAHYGAFPHNCYFLGDEAKLFGSFCTVFVDGKFPVKRFGECWNNKDKRRAILSGALQGEEDLDKLAETLKQQQEIPQFRF